MYYKTIDVAFNNFLINIKEYFSQEKNITLFKKRNIIKIVEFNSIKYVVKSFKIPHLLNQIIYGFFRDSKARRSYENSVKLLELGVNTPKPVGFIEFSTLVFFRNSYYVSEYFDYDFEIRAVFKDAAFNDRENILKQFMDFSLDIHNKGVYHIDYSPGNILVKKIDDNYMFFIIDVNRMKFLDFNIDLRMKSLSKLTSDTEDNLAMLKYYAIASSIDINLLKEKFEFYLQEQKKYLMNKKRLKKMRG